MLMERYLNNEVKKYPHHRVRRTKKRKKRRILRDLNSLLKKC